VDEGVDAARDGDTEVEVIDDVDVLAELSEVDDADVLAEVGEVNGQSKAGDVCTAAALSDESAASCARSGDR